MSAQEIQPPVFMLVCDFDGCSETYQAESRFDSRFPNTTRGAARWDGWDVPPYRGKGSRRGTDFCPKHAQKGGGCDDR